jgi:steroid 5-alpha reductase family enzyme
LWGLRLSLYILARKWGKPEDWRYAQWRSEWMQQGYDYFMARSLLQIFLLQGVFMMLVAMPIVALYLDGAGLVLPIIIGTLVWLVGFLFESIGDLQLYLFKQHPGNKDKIMTSGLWRFTRHPNYFGEVTQWWGLWLLTLGTTWWWAALISPIVITFLILKVSGITMLEKKYAGNPEFQAYKQRTSAFLPWIPRKKTT